jgi:linoleoyl-CoA desaturase
MQKIKFNAGASSPFFRSLDEDVHQLLVSGDLLTKARKKLWIKMVFYFLLHAAAYVTLFVASHPSLASLVLNYIFIGISGLLLGFNVSHDAMHGSFSKNRDVNHWLYHLSFNIQGTSAYLWKVRHIGSHHVFPNVDGCDADIDDNPFIRLSPQHPLKNHQRYQHLYSIFVYCFYTLHWLLFKDLYYLFAKKVGNLQNKKHPLKEYFIFFGWKIFYLSVILLLPLTMDHAFTDILLAFFAMHMINSLLFIHFLISTHFCMEAQFPKTDEHGTLPYDYYTHQLATSLDYSPRSRFFNLIVGGFNAHAAHHLFPKLPHTIYPDISPLIEQKTKEFQMPYNKLTLLQSIRSHYRYLKMMGQTKQYSSHSGNLNQYQHEMSSNKKKSSCIQSRNCATCTTCPT